MRIMRVSAFLLGALLGAPFASASQPIAAIVEEVSGGPAGVEFMDYLETGKVIELGPRGVIVLSYLHSCMRETIHGGSVKIGVSQSEVQSGRVERAKVDCEAAQMIDTTGQDSASLIVRGDLSGKLPDPEFTLHGASPVFELKGAGSLVVRRLDKAGEDFSLPVNPIRIGRRLFFDFATQNKVLIPGGLYEVGWGRKVVVFRIDPGAKSGRGPIIGRWVRLGTAS